MYRLSRRFRKRFGTKDAVDGKRKKDEVEHKIVLLDGSDLTFNLHKKAKAQELIDLVFKNLDLEERDYFGLQFMDKHQVSHWLNPLKKIKKQVKIGPPYTLHFRVKFYAAEPQNLGEELTRYHFFLQIKKDTEKGKLEVPQKTAVNLAAYALQSHIGDYDPEVHGSGTEYMTEFKFIPTQTKELEKEILKKHKALVGLNPADCEVNFLRQAKSLDFYGIDQHNVVGANKMEYILGLTPKGIMLIRENQKLTLFMWPKIKQMKFKKNKFHLEVEDQDQPGHVEHYQYTLANSKASKNLWKCAIEHHIFFRLIKPSNKPKRTASFMRFGSSRFRFSGRTEYQANRDSRMSARKAMRIQRTMSERFAKRSTIGFIRVGSRVWGRALNGDYYKGLVTGLGDMVHIKFDNGDSIAHDRTDPDCVVFDKDPDPQDIEVGTRVIAHWPSIGAYMAGTVIEINGEKYHVEYYDGDKRHIQISQLRVLKPPAYFGPGATTGKKVKKAESMKVTSLTGKAVITTELPRRNVSKSSNGSLKSSSKSSRDESAKGGSTSAKNDYYYYKVEASPIKTLPPDVFDETSATSAPCTTTAGQVTSAVVTSSVDPRRHVATPAATKTVNTANTKSNTLPASSLLQERTSIVHMRSASLPMNVKAPSPSMHPKTETHSASSSPLMPQNRQKPPRNKSFGGATKNSRRKGPPTGMSALPETDIDSGIALKEQTRSGKRNLHAFNLTRAELQVLEKEAKIKEKNAQLRVNLPPEQLSKQNGAPGKLPSRYPSFDEQRSFVVYVPEKPQNKRHTHMGAASNSDDLLQTSPKESPDKKRRSSLPDLRSFNSPDEEMPNPVERAATPPKKNRSMNDLAKTTPSNAQDTPLNIGPDNHRNGTWDDSDLFSPRMEQSPSSNKLLLVTDL